MLETRCFAVAAALAVGFATGARAQSCESDFNATDFSKKEVATNLTSPVKMKIAADSSIFFIQRTGVVQLLAPGSSTPKQILKLNVPGGSQNEDGLIGIALDPQFASNKWIYLYYTPTGPMGYRVSRFTFTGTEVDPASEKVLLTIPHAFSAYGALIIHGAGAMAFDLSGNLLVATGDLCITNGGFPVPVNENTNNFDAQRSSANSNNLLGKILRIHPEDNGTYTVPARNLFEKGMAGTMPEIYAMGVRNPYTMTVDPQTGWIYSGEVGPDGVDGPIKSQDEINQIKEAGNFGWPYLTGDNQAYSDMKGTKYSADNLVNNSKNNTGIKNLPAPVKSFFWTSNVSSWPITGITPKAGRRCIKVGGFYRWNAQGTNAKRLPLAFDNGFFMANHDDGETMRFFKLNATGNLVSVKTFMTNLARPMSFEVGPDGALYVMEWGGDNGHWFNANNGKISRIEYTGNCNAVGIRHDFSKEALYSQGITTVLPGSRIVFPKGAARVDLYDLKGAKRWSAPAAGSIYALVPADFEAGLMYVKFSAI
ncbi:MAG TPA: PQQ-dependent sugar dehydrogenase [Fibrobacteria bacterium]|nr:PQQ-dependent sugar dehydrogenase [Fibrobacteria bacterium]